MTDVTAPTVIIDGKQYELDKISNEVKEIGRAHV